MDRLTVNGSTSYDVIIEQGILDRVGELVRDEIAGEKALIITDTNVSALYLDTVAASLDASGYAVSVVEFEASDASKSMDNYVDILSVLAEHEFSGTDVIVALGGGMIGDIAGFAGATYKRGMKRVMIPTSLLAAVDAAVGGKTAINLPSGKNQVGTISNPSIVICDPDTMSTLSDAALHDGYAEILKYGILTGYTIIDELRAGIASGDYSQVIRTSIAIKRDVVERDEGDQTYRQFLNLGHLVGHAIEALSEYSVSHGQAVAEGLAIESRCAALSGLSAMSTHLEISDLLEEFGFDISKAYSLSDLTPYIAQDKRLRAGTIAIIVPELVGQCTMRSISADMLATYVNAGL